jgi:casein kinase II subunit alpha
MSRRADVAAHATAEQDYGVSVARVHRDYNLERAREYWDYENITITWGRHENYAVTGKLGEGKFSEVFRGRHVRSRRRCVVKVLKPIRPKKIKREISVLQNLSGGPNIIQLLDLVRDPYSGTPSLVFEYVDNVEFRTLYPQLSPLDVRFFMFELLRALSHCHSHGIMHRDIKPHNIMIDPRRRQLRLIDWGLAEFYFPGQEYHVRVASRYFKGPELLVGLRCYDYSLDMWSFGCTFGAIVLRREPLFRGRDNQDQLRKVAEILGAKVSSFMYRYILRESCSQFDSLPLTSLTTTSVEQFSARRNCASTSSGTASRSRAGCRRSRGRCATRLRRGASFATTRSASKMRFQRRSATGLRTTTPLRCSKQR